MDLLKLMKEKLNYFSSFSEFQSISSVVNHIETAEKHYENGKLGNDYLFNDVIYRSNQAFEGALKEAYKIIAGKDNNKTSPLEIEKYFETNKILKERVLALLTNYRTEWRNKSTHDYTLYFSEQEALLAIVSISAFANILFDQMIEKLAYESELEYLRNNPVSASEVEDVETLYEKIESIIQQYAKEIDKNKVGVSVGRIFEAEMIGSLTAYINSFDSSITVEPEPVLYSSDGMRRLQPDFVISQDDEKIIIETKLYKAKRTVRESDIQQVLSYLLETGITQGVLFVASLSSTSEMKIERIDRVIGDKTYIVKVISPVLNTDKTENFA